MKQRLWIDEPADDATPELNRISKKWRDQGRPMPGIMASMKLSPNTLVNVMRMNNAVTFGAAASGVDARS